MHAAPVPVPHTHQNKAEAKAFVEARPVELLDAAQVAMAKRREEGEGQGRANKARAARRRVERRFAQPVLLGISIWHGHKQLV
jgi:hypothetical protein